jgi:hypothetical protein
MVSPPERYMKRLELIFIFGLSAMTDALFESVHLTDTSSESRASPGPNHASHAFWGGLAAL